MKRGRHNIKLIIDKEGLKWLLAALGVLWVLSGLLVALSEENITHYAMPVIMMSILFIIFYILIHIKNDERG
ncbi:hypothetical protein [Pectinatus frisingensis]|uniref:hypothetical protein n=1 Tax=Pectinatus frisingensis TaxID=865 RepID=UPI0018C63308|nr:hypothetical protein [Pectinatus frisingensis]